MDADSSVSADLVLVALSAPRSRPPPALSCHVTRAGPPPVGPDRSTPERTSRRQFDPEKSRGKFKKRPCSRKLKKFERHEIGALARPGWSVEPGDRLGRDRAD